MGDESPHNGENHSIRSGQAAVTRDQPRNDENKGEHEVSEVLKVLRHRHMNLELRQHI
jgi:hypothetical protein